MRLAIGGCLMDAHRVGEGGIENIIEADGKLVDNRGKSHLFILNYQGYEAQKIPLPDRGAMPVPTIADVNRNGTMEIIVSLKVGVVGERQVLVYEVPGSDDNYLPWPTGRVTVFA